MKFNINITTTNGWKLDLTHGERWYKEFGDGYMMIQYYVPEFDWCDVVLSTYLPSEDTTDEEYKASRCKWYGLEYTTENYIVCALIDKAETYNSGLVARSEEEARERVYEFITEH